MNKSICKGWGWIGTEVATHCVCPTCGYRIKKKKEDRCLGIKCPKCKTVKLVRCTVKHELQDSKYDCKTKLVMTSKEVATKEVIKKVSLVAEK